MDLAEFKESQRHAWEAGDYRQVGRLLDQAARELVSVCGVAPGQRVLDAATGSGSVAIAAARAGADVVGLDLTDAWFDEARRRAREAGVEAVFDVGDVEGLPVADGSFDAVLSSFGAVFAPRHDVVAGELTRACRPGGTIALTAWTPDSPNGRLFTLLGGYLPPPPDFVRPAVRWGEPDHVRELFAAHPVSLAFQRSALTLEFPSPEAFEAFMLGSSGPVIAARQILEQLGRWQAAHHALRAMIAESNEADDGAYRTTWDFLIAVGAKAP